MGAKKKDPNAVALGRKGGKARKENLSADDLTRIGRKGASERYKGMSKEQRSESARKAVMVRWAKNKRKEEE